MRVAKARAMGMRGDPGLFGTLGKAFKTAASFIPGPIGAVASLIPTQGRPSAGGTAVQVFKNLPIVKAGRKVAEAYGYGKMAQDFAGGMKNVGTDLFGKKRKKYRRMNPLNPKALTRGIRRISKFQDFARSVGFSRAPSVMRGVRAPKRRRRSCK